MDPLSEVLRSVRLTGSAILSGHFTAPWCISVKITPDDCAIYLPIKPAQMICYHVVIEGRLLVAVDGEPMIEVGAGEIVLFPQNDTHTLADERGIGPVSAVSAYSTLAGRRPCSDIPRRGWGGDAHRVRVPRQR